MTNSVQETPHALVVGGGVQGPEAGIGAQLNAGFFSLPPVLKDLIAQETVTEDTKTESNDQGEDATSDRRPSLIFDSDVWLHDSFSVLNVPELRTWDTFDRHSCRTPPLTFITEASLAAFDTLVNSRQPTNHAEFKVISDGAYLVCLLNLTLGRSSSLFSWDSKKKIFAKTTPELRTLGLSLQSIQGVDKLCLECATATRQLQTFTERAYSTASNSTMVALAGALDKLALALQSEVNFHGRSARSILQLQSVVRPVHAVLTYVRDLAEKLAGQESDEGILSQLFQEAQLAEYRSTLLQDVTREILRLVFRPWADFVEEWVGLKLEGGMALTKTGPGRAFVKTIDKVWIDDMGYELEEADFFLDEDKLPSFFPGDVARATFEAGRNLRFLREYHPNHPLSRQQGVKMVKPPSLEWQFSWESLASVKAKANKYQDSVSCQIQKFHHHHHHQGPSSSQAASKDTSDARYELAVFGRDDAQIAANFLASISHLDAPIKNTVEKSGFAAILRGRLYQQEEDLSTDQRLSPHWSLVPLLSFGPVINAQARLIDRECMRVLFGDHQLRMHIDLLRQYYLLDNGLLCSRLSNALFDPDLETAERKAGVALGGEQMGLRLGGRENWPPASSELRLALMGVLSESYQHPPGYVQGTKGLPSRSYGSDLPGDLSFAVRDLSPSEIDRCMDPDSLEALDFLRLSYKAPPPLRPILTPTVLVKYDRIFMSLLRVQRMLFVVNQLLHDVTALGLGNREPSDAALRFRIEARHFVHQVATYFFEIGVIAPWERFETWLDSAETEINSKKGAGGAENYSPDLLRDRQEQVLDEIMSTLLLRKRQQPVLKLLEETFTVILRFAKQIRLQHHAVKETNPDSLATLYSTFTKKVEVFLAVCKGLGEKATANKTASHSMRKPTVENPIEHLLLLADLSGFYRKLADN